MSADSFSKNLWYLITKSKTSPLPQIARFHFFSWKLDKMTRHIAQELALGGKISQYFVCDTLKEPVWCVDSRTGFEKKKSLAPEMCKTLKPNQLVWGLLQIFKIQDSVKFIVSCDGSIHVLWTYQDRVLVFGYIERILTKPRLCDYRSIIACYLHMQPWVARFPLPDFQ